MRTAPVVLSVPSMLRGLWLAAGLVLAACGGDDGGDHEQRAAAACEAGKVEPCPCVGSDEMGAQTCADDGSKWGACACAEPSNPSLTVPNECSGPIAPATLLAHERCPADRQYTFDKCSDAILDTPTCVRHMYLFCCDAPAS